MIELLASLKHLDTSLKFLDNELHLRLVSNEKYVDVHYEMVVHNPVFFNRGSFNRGSSVSDKYNEDKRRRRLI